MTTEITPDSLTPLFKQHLGPEVSVDSVDRGPLGNGQEIWFVETSDPNHLLVLRRTAASGPLTWTDRAAEFRVLQSLALADLPIPTVRWADDTGGPLGRSYFVMDRLPGKPVQREDPETLALIGSDLGHMLAKLHLVEPRGDTGPTLSAAEATQHQLTLWRQRYHQDRLGPVPLIGLLLAWLERNAPSSTAPAVLLWGDPGPHNVLHTEGEITGLLDWELSHLGDPLEDLGAALWSCTGVCDPEALLAGYEQERAIAVDRDAVTYFEILACVTRSIMLVNAVGQYVAGATTAPNLAGLGLHLVHANMDRALQLLGRGSTEVPEVIGSSMDTYRLRPDMAELLAGVAAFLRDDVQPHVADRRLTRGLKTVDALLATVALRIDIEDGVEQRRRQLRDELFIQLDAAGVDVSHDLEHAAIIVETDDRFVSLRETVWRALIDDLGITGALVRPLTELYEGS